MDIAEAVPPRVLHAVWGSPALESAACVAQCDIRSHYNACLFLNPVIHIVDGDKNPRILQKQLLRENGSGRFHNQGH
jgi:hypothetical protein